MTPDPGVANEPAPPTAGGKERLRNLLFLTQPQLWPLWPFLPLVRRRPGAEKELGLLYDAVGDAQRYGLSATVYLTNLYLVPANRDEFLQTPHETYDRPEEIYAAGWRVD